MEVEDDSGKSISAGTWTERPDGLWALRINVPPEGEWVPSALAHDISYYANGYAGSDDNLDGALEALKEWEANQ